MNNLNQSFQEYITYLYSTITIHQLILYYFVIYLIFKFIQRIFDIKIDDTIPNINAKIIFVMTLVVFFEYLIYRSSLFYYEDNLLNVIILSSIIFVILLYFIKYIIRLLFNAVYYSYSKTSLGKKITSKKNKEMKLNLEKIKLISNNAYNNYSKELIQVYIDTFILFAFIFHFLNTNDYLLLIVITLLTFVNCYYSYKENLIMKIYSDVEKLKKNVNNYVIS